MRDRSSRPRAHASGAESVRVGVVPGCHRCAIRPVFSWQTTAAAQLWPLYTTTSSRVLQRHLSDDGALADMEVAKGGPRRVHGRSMVRCGGNHRNSGRRFRCFGRAASRRSPSRPSVLGQFRWRPRKPLFSKKNRSSECAKVAPDGHPRSGFGRSGRRGRIECRTHSVCRTPHTSATLVLVSVYK